MIARDGHELWKSDGTAAGTVLVKDINLGRWRSLYFYSLTALGDTLFFRANDGVHGDELWKSDGSAAGTTLVKDINPTGSSDPGWLIVVGSTLFFLADDGMHGRELWKSDGTEAGTSMVKDINPTSSSTPDDPAAVGDTLFFTANDGTHGRELWTSDGTPAGTALVLDMYTGPTGSDPRLRHGCRHDCVLQCADRRAGYRALGHRVALPPGVSAAGAALATDNH